MPSVHVIYDPEDKISIPSQDYVKEIGCVLAFLKLEEEPKDKADIEKVIKSVLDLLMDQFA